MFHSDSTDRIVIIADYPNPYWLHVGIITGDDTTNAPNAPETPQDGPGCDNNEQ